MLGQQDGWRGRGRGEPREPHLHPGPCGSPADPSTRPPLSPTLPLGAASQSPELGLTLTPGPSTELSVSSEVAGSLLRCILNPTK